MKQFRLLLEKGAYPLWIVYEDGGEDSKLPERLNKYKELDKKLWKLQDLFDKQFVDNEKEFYAKGFETEEERCEFINLAEEVREEVLEKLYENYDIGKEYEIDTESFDKSIEMMKVEKLYPENQEKESESMFKMLKDYFKKWDD